MNELILTGEFVDLVPLRPEHAELTFQWRQGDRATYLNRGASSLEQQSAWIASRPASEYNFIIQLKSGCPVGMLALCNVDELHRHAESGRFLIGDEEAVKGIPAAVEAMKMLYELAFDRLKLARVFGTIPEDNKLMIKWQKFLGMKEEGRLRNHYFFNDRLQDCVMFGILEAEFRNTALPRMKSLITAGRLAAAAKSGTGESS